MDLKKWLKLHSSCPYGYRWVLKSGATFETVWELCPNTAWLNWLLDSTLCQHENADHSACLYTGEAIDRAWWRLLSFTATGSETNLAYLGNFWILASRGLFDNAALDEIRAEFREYWNSQLPRLKQYS